MGIILEILSGNSMDEIDFPDKEFSEDIEDKEKEEKGKNQNNTKEDKRTVEAKKFLDNFGTNLNEKAKHGQIDKVIGREKEIERLVEILNRRKKNNPCIIGEPGVGKTALAQGLALRIVEGDVPAKLMDKEI